MSAARRWMPLYGRDIERELGLPPGEFGQVLHTLC